MPLSNVKVSTIVISVNVRDGIGAHYSKRNWIFRLNAFRNSSLDSLIPSESGTAFAGSSCVYSSLTLRSTYPTCLAPRAQRERAVKERGPNLASARI